MNRRSFMKWLGIGSIAGIALPVVADVNKPAINKTNAHRIQLLMQLHDKQLISTSDLMAEVNLNYDEEVEKLRREQDWWFKSRNIA